MTAVPDETTLPTGVPASVRASHVAVRRGIGNLIATLLLPGSVQLRQGSRALGRVALTVWGVVIGLGLLTLLLALVARGALLTVLANGFFYKALQPILIILGLGWALLMVDSWRLSRPLDMQQRSRAIFGVVALVMAVVMGWGAISAGTIARAQGEMLASILGGGGSSEETNGRYNVLLLGSDAGSNRDGVRPDSITVASIDAKTGRSVLFSLPRNLEGAPFPKSSPLHALYPNGYDCADNQCMLNGIYTLAEDHKDLYPGVKRPGLQATKEVVEELLGLKINYLAMIDMQGFITLIDALGGITLDINKRVPIGGGTSKVSGYIEPGKGVKLDGHKALWFARSRHGASDYERMTRQKCVINAVLQQAQPATVLAKFTDLSKAGKELAVTDVPSSDVNMLMDLAMKAKSKPISSVSFTPPLLYPGNPKLDVIRSTVADKIAASEALDKKGGQKAPATTQPTAKPPPTSSAKTSSTPTVKPSKADDNGTPKPVQDDIGVACSAP